MLFQQVFADTRLGAVHQRIGNYNVEMRMDPLITVAGDHNTRILLKISTVGAGDTIVLPIAIKISKAGSELTRTNPILAPFGHYSYQYTFREPGIYALDVSICDISFSNQNVTFTFPIKVHTLFSKFFSLSSPFSSSLLANGPVLVAIASSGGIVVGIILARRRKSREKNIH
jgi:hypothetical protein